MTKIEISVSEALRQMPIRPVYLVTSEHDGKRNIISIGMFALFSSRPPLVGVGIAPSRFSFDLIKRSGEYAVNVVDERLADAVRICGEESGRDVDKFERANLTPMKGLRVKSPLIEESPVSLECQVIKEVEAGDHIWFVAEVLATHVQEGYNWKDGLLFKWIGEDGVYFKAGEKIREY